MSIEITDRLVDTFALACPASGLRWREDIAAGLAAVLDLPEVRQAIHDDVRRETDDDEDEVTA
jgi:hypothetical protein